MTTSVRYIVREMGAAVAFYQRIGFDVEMQPGPASRFCVGANSGCC